MKTNEKIKYIEEYLSLFNETIFKNRTYNLHLVKEDKKYCIQLINRKVREITRFKYNTYDDLIETIKLLEFIFTKEEKYVKNKNKDNKRKRVSKN